MATTPAQSLAGAMRRNPRLRVFFASGIYDLCTTAGNARYLAAHSNLDMSRVTRGEYPSGHMACLREDSARMLGADMRRFFSQALGLEGEGKEKSAPWGAFFVGGRKGCPGGLQAPRKLEPCPQGRVICGICPPG